MKNRSRLTIFATMLSVLACFGLLPQMQAAPEVAPQPDGCYPGFTTAEGCKALNFLTSGAGNTGIGWYSLYVNSTGSYNTGLGAGALVLNNADSNTAVGAAALLLNTTGSENTAVGTDALVHNDSGFADNAVGAFALFSNTTGSFNNAHGREALNANTTGIENEAFGDFALLNNQTGDHNVAVGDNALENADADDNTAVGRNAGVNVTTGTGNIYLGAGARGPGDEVRFLRIGDSSFTDYDCFIVGIKDREVDAGTASLVLVDGNQKVGTVPVDAAGHPVKFQAMLNDALKQQTRIAELEGTVARLAAMVKEQAAQIQKVSAQLEVRKPATKVAVGNQ